MIAAQPDHLPACFVSLGLKRPEEPDTFERMRPSVDHVTCLNEWRPVSGLGVTVVDQRCVPEYFSKPVAFAMNVANYDSPLTLKGIPLLFAIEIYSTRTL